MGSSPLIAIINNFSKPVTEFDDHLVNLGFYQRHKGLKNIHNPIKFNILDYEYFSIPYVFDKIPNSQDGHQIP